MRDGEDVQSSIASIRLDDALRRPAMQRFTCEVHLTGMRTVALSSGMPELTPAVARC
jgi:hypothetical protein